MFRRIATLVIVLPLAAVIIAFAVANRQIVTVSFDPFSAASPAYSATLPLFILIFVLVIFGVIVGGSAAWLRQAKWRRVARQLDGENRRLQQELQAARGHLAAEAQRAAEPAYHPRETAERPVPAITPPAS